MNQNADVVRLAFDAVLQLGQDWTDAPSYWEREADLVADLACRIRGALRVIGRDWVFDRGNVNDEPRGPTRYGAVGINTCILGPTGIGNVYPDIVVWGDAPKAPSYLSTGWPVLWACEVKFTFGDCGILDYHKLEALVASKRVQSGCYLQFVARGQSCEHPKPQGVLRHLKFTADSPKRAALARRVKAL